MGKYFHFLVSLLTASLPLNGAFSPPNPINLNGNLDVPEESEISLRNEYFYRYQMDTTVANFIVETAVLTENTTEYPVTFVVRKQRLSKSWHLPEETYPGIYSYQSNRTVCLSEYMTADHPFPKEKAAQKTVVTVEVSSLSPDPIRFSILVRNVCNRLVVGHLTQTIVGITTPQVFHFNYSQTQNFHSNVIAISLRSEDPKCLTVSIQNPKCPIYDLEENVYSEGFWHTMTYRDTITLQRHEHPHGFFLVLVLNKNTDKCVFEQVPRIDSNFTSVTKTVELVLNESTSDFQFHLGWALTLAIYLVLLVIAVLALCKTQRNKYHASAQTDLEMQESPPRNQLISGANHPSTSQQTGPAPPVPTFDKAVQFIGVNGLGFPISVLAVALFHSIPAFRLLFMYLGFLRETGNHDICYYNNECAYPLWDISDFFRVYSNIGYLIMSLATIICTYILQRKYRQQQHQSDLVRPRFDISYAIGVSTFFVGVFSSIYHLCPNRENFHFDTSFMYVTASLAAIKVYKTRRPLAKICPYWFTFCIAIIIVTDYVAEWTQDWAYLIFFTILHMSAVLWTCKHHFNVKLEDLQYLCKERTTKLVSNKRGVPTTRVVRIVALLFVINIVIALIPLVKKLVWPSNIQDFSTHILLILGVSFVAYLACYLASKCFMDKTKRPEEKLHLATWLNAGCSLLFWVVGVVFFMKKKVAWAKQPAGSRAMNAPCILDFVYDTHDYWHLCSAIALFATANVLNFMDMALWKGELHVETVEIF